MEHCLAGPKESVASSSMRWIIAPGGGEREGDGAGAAASRCTYARKPEAHPKLSSSFSEGASDAPQTLIAFRSVADERHFQIHATAPILYLKAKRASDQHPAHSKTRAALKNIMP